MTPPRSTSASGPSVSACRCRLAMNENVLKALCHLPLDFAAGGVTVIRLLRASGYAREVTEQDIEEYLRAHPSLFDAWYAYSDQRSSAAFYLAAPGEGVDRKNGLRVGYMYSSGELAPEETFADKFAACARFVKMHAEQLRLHGG